MLRCAHVFDLQDLEKLLDDVMVFFRYIHGECHSVARDVRASHLPCDDGVTNTGQDIFEAHYKKHLAKVSCISLCFSYLYACDDLRPHVLCFVGSAIAAWKECVARCGAAHDLQNP